MIHFLVLAGGEGKRAQSEGSNIPKQFNGSSGVSPLKYLLRFVNNLNFIDTITVVIPKKNIQDFMKISKNINKLRRFVIGGDSRQSSSYKGLENIVFEFGENEDDCVLIHDAARPIIEENIIKNCIEGLNKNDGTFPAINVDDTIKKFSNENKFEEVNREEFFLVQTPQVFKLRKIYKAHIENKKKFTDDVSLALASGLNIQKMDGSKSHFKITNYEDLIFYDKIIKGTHLNKNGIGFDIHVFTEGNFIKLGGVKIKSNFGLKANSDGDVVIHSITDAILGALEKNDIGFHFSPDNKDYKDVDSKIFLDKALNYLNEVDGEIINLDTNIICDIPKIDPFRKDIKKNLSKLLGVDENKINIKASSTENQGFVNSQNGVAAQTIVSLQVPKQGK